MSIPDFRQTVSQYLTPEKVSSLLQQLGSNPAQVRANEYQANVQVITWAILEKLTASNAFPVEQLTEENVRPFVDDAMNALCDFIPHNHLLIPDILPPSVLSRKTWWAWKFSRQQLEF